MPDTEQTLDVRRLAPRDRHSTIFAVWAALPPGGSFLLVNDHEPKPLYYQFQAEHAGEFQWTPVEKGPETWSVRIARVAPSKPKAAVACGNTERSSEATAKPSWAGQVSVEVDARPTLRAGGEPFSEILGGVQRTPSGGVLLVRAIFEPVPLYSVLGKQGFTEHWAERLADDDWAVYLRRS